jgi:hypothetical protein
MPLRSITVILSLLVFVYVAKAQTSFTINSISLPDGNTTFQGAPASSSVNFTEGDGFVDSVSGYHWTNFVAVVEFLEGAYR